MRTITCLGLLALGFGAVAFIPAITMGQQGGFGKGKGNRGGASFDAGAYFDRISNGKSSMLVTEIRTNRPQELKQFLQERGITNGQVTRQQWVEFSQQILTQAKPPGGSQGNKGPGGRGPGGQFGAPGGTITLNPGGGFNGNPNIDFGGGFKKKNFNFTPGGGGPGGPRGDREAGDTLDPETINKWSDAEFKKRDRNGDGRLNKDEMPQSLRDSLARWDTNGDGLIDQREYRDYVMNRTQGDDRNSKGVASIIIQEDELDRKPVVFRIGGAMPANLPPWFKELDYDADGQIALWEWRKGGKDLDDYSAWDLNDDGFITPEEAMRQQNILAGNSGAAGNGDPASLADGGQRPAFMPGTFGQGGGFGKGKKNGGGFGGFGGNQGGGGAMPGFGNGGGFGKGKGGFGGFGKGGGGKKGKKNGGGQ